VLFNPYTWGLVGVCFAGGWYAKKELAGAVAAAVCLPFFLLFTWFVGSLVTALIGGVLTLVSPGAAGIVAAQWSLLPEALRFVLHPATLLSGFLFVLYCRSERRMTNQAPIISPRREQLTDFNVFHRQFVR
ncbi:MAG: hypothetical protein AAGJ79_07505, partial [Verrucomicrobiota bacterium]